MIKLIFTRSYLILIFFIIFKNSIADQVDLDCKVKRWGSQWSNFLSATKNSNSQWMISLKPIPHEKGWWQILNSDYDDEMYFSIDTLHQKSVYADDYGNSNSLTIVTPYQILIETFYHCDTPDITKCSGLMFQYKINRITGKIEGDYSAADDSYMPYFKSGDIVYSFRGSCDLIKRRF